MEENENEWKLVNDGTWRLKVNGGMLYKTSFEDTCAMSFVPDVDLQRYASHLRDAYTQGYKAGHDDAKRGVEAQLA